MKSHDFAKSLTLMAKILKSGPNVDIEDLDVSNSLFSTRSKFNVSNEEIPHALNILVGLNQVPKQQWVSLIDEFGFDIQIRQRDANRDIYGKLLSYLSENPGEREKLIRKKGKQAITSSSELANALTLLMK